MARLEVSSSPTADSSAEQSTGRRLSQHIRNRIRGSVSQKVNITWDENLPRLVVSGDSDEFDPTIIAHLQAEGFQISYLTYAGDQKAYHDCLQHLADPLEAGEKYAIVAYGDAATLCLEACMKPMPKLVAMIAYYPSFIPQGTPSFPSTLQVQIHLAASQKFGTRYPSFRYPDTEPGFAEHDLDEYSKIASTLAWSRTLGVLRSAFDIHVDLESIWDHHTALEFAEKDADKTMTTMVSQPYVNHIPTMTGGIGATDLRRFYAEFFIPGNPADMRLTLLSRTVGVDRVVDELLITFRHTCEIPWMLPGIPPTDKRVEVVLVAVVCIRGRKIYHEHLHWDQATVLVQIGLLDPKLVPQGFRTVEEGKEKEVRRLPVWGAEAARKCVDEAVGRSNELIPGW